MNPFFKSYHETMKEKFGCRIYKVSIDAPFSCPNRDGTKGFGGCIFCDGNGSSSRTSEKISIKQQILKNIEHRKNRFKAKKFIAYFQSFSNTYKNVHELEKIYAEALFAHPDIIGMSISTRSDCIDEEKIQLISKYKKSFPYINIEYGLQSIHSKTLSFINRRETLNDFLKALELSRAYSIEPSVHVILNLPNESVEDQLKTADFLAEHKIQGVKIHILSALKNTYMEKLYLEKKWIPYSYSEIIHLLCSFLERLHPETTIHRLSGSGYPKDIIAPSWIYPNKHKLIEDIKAEFLKRNTQQGSFCNFFSKDHSSLI